MTTTHDRLERFAAIGSGTNSAIGVNRMCDGDPSVVRAVGLIDPRLAGNVVSSTTGHDYLAT
jgi:hypothetical protein